MRTYDYIAWKEEGIWTAHSPSVPGVYGLGDTCNEAEQDLIEALGELLEHLEDIGERAPRGKKLVSGSLQL